MSTEPRRTPPCSVFKSAAGRALFAIAEHFPRAKQQLQKWGLRTVGLGYGRRVGHVQLPGGRAFQLASISEDYLSLELFWRGGGYYEPVTRLLLQSLVRAGDTFVDVGANIGFYSVVISLACPAARVISFEPNPGNYALLRQNLAVNGVANVQCEALAVSDTETEATLYLSQSHMSASLCAGFEDATGATTVRTVTLDGYFGRQPGSGAMIMKVDVEGHEEALFRGAEAVLEKYVPDIVTEVALRYGAGPTAQLQRHGYRFYPITNRGFAESPDLVPVIAGDLVFLNYFLSARPREEVRELFNRMAPAIAGIDFRNTSKYLSPLQLERFKERLARA